MKTKQANNMYLQVVILAGPHVVSRDFSDEFPCSGVRVIHKMSLNGSYLWDIFTRVGNRTRLFGVAAMSHK